MNKDTRGNRDNRENTDNRKNIEAEETIAELLSEIVADELDQLPKRSITREELHMLEQENRQARRKKATRYICLAAAVLLVLSAAIFVPWSKVFPPSEANKGTKKVEEQREDTIVIEDESADGGVGEKNIVTQDWAYVERIKKEHPDFLVPTYVPKGYQFSKLTWENLDEKMFLSEFIFKNKEGVSLYIVQRVYKKEDADFIEQCYEILFVNGEKVYIMKNRQVIAAHLIKGGQTIVLTGNQDFSKKEIRKVMEGLR